MIELKNIYKKYNNGKIENNVLNNINIKIKENELVAIVGPSGSGKSTLLNIIGLMDEYSSGEYIFNNSVLNITNMNSKDLAYIRNTTFGFVYQNFALIDDLTIKENLELPLKYRCKHEKIKFNKRDAKEKILKYLRKFKLEDKIDNYPYELSGGEQQRISIIRAIINDTKVILADEPTGALDNDMSMRVFDFLIELKKENKTIIVVTHDLKIAEKCERIIRL